MRPSARQLALLRSSKARAGERCVTREIAHFLGCLLPVTVLVLGLGLALLTAIRDSIETLCPHQARRLDSPRGASRHQVSLFPYESVLQCGVSERQRAALRSRPRARPISPATPRLPGRADLSERPQARGGFGGVGLAKQPPARRGSPRSDQPVAPRAATHTGWASIGAAVRARPPARMKDPLPAGSLPRTRAGSIGASAVGSLTSDTSAVVRAVAPATAVGSRSCPKPRPLPGRIRRGEGAPRPATPVLQRALESVSGSKPLAFRRSLSGGRRPDAPAPRSS